MAETQESQEKEKTEKMAKIIHDARSAIERHEKRLDEVEVKWRDTSESKAMMEKMAEDVKRIDEKGEKEIQAAAARDLETKDFREKTTATIEELKAMYAEQNRPAPGGESTKDAEHCEEIFYKMLRYGGLEHGGMAEKEKYELTEPEIKSYGDYMQKSLGNMSTFNLSRAGAMTIPPTIINQMLDVAKQEITNVRRYTRNFRIRSREMEIPLMTSHGIATPAYEAQATAKDTEQAFGLKPGRLHKYFHRFFLTHEQIQFGVPNLINVLKTDQGKAFSKTLGTAHVTGTGTGEPEGILNDTGIQIVNMEETTSITTIDFLSLAYHTLKAIYAQNARWMTHRLTFFEISTVKGSDGHYIVTMPRERPEFLLWGLPIIQSQDMPVVASGSKPIVLADFNELYATLDFSGPTIRIEDPYTQKDSGVDFLTFAWFGGHVINQEAGIICKMDVT